MGGLTTKLAGRPGEPSRLRLRRLDHTDSSREAASQPISYPILSHPIPSHSTSHHCGDLEL